MRDPGECCEHSRGAADLRKQIDMSEAIALPEIEEPDIRCTRCKITKPAEAFHKSGGGKRRSRCAACRAEARPSRRGQPSRQRNRLAERAAERAAELKAKYGITVRQYDLMLIAQDGRCAICRRPPAGRRLAVDHCHASGRVRALLCDTCNRWLGCYERIQEQATAYLADYGEGNPLLKYDKQP